MKKITIKVNEYDEYEVPGLTPRQQEIYFTDDKEDAILTAKKIHGEDIVIRFRK